MSVKKSLKQRYLSSAFILLLSTVVVKLISAFYKIPLTGFIGAEGRGYFSIAYNFCMPIHALTMGAFPLALTKLVSSHEAKGDYEKIKALRFASKRLFLIVGVIGLAVMLIFAKPYAELISSAPKSIYTILALAPSVFFCCLGAAHRGFAEGYLDMKPTAVSQLLEALFKLVFGLLFARYSMSWLYEQYILNGAVLGMSVSGEQEALSAIYPLTSAAAMLGVTFGSIVAYLFVMIYTKSKYPVSLVDKTEIKLAYNELLTFSTALIGATVISSISNFVDTSSIQYCLSLCDADKLAALYNYSGNDVYTYVFGIFATVLDFKNLVPAIVMVLGVTAVPAVSTAYENSSGKFSSLLTSIFKYAVILSVAGGLILSVFSKEILSIFYSNSNADIVDNGSYLLKIMGIFILPCALATVTVYTTQALGFAKSTIPAFIISCVLRLAVNFIFIPDSEYNVLAAAISNSAGFLIVVVMNLITIRKKTNARFSCFDIFIKPVFCGIITYIAVSYAKLSVSLTFPKLILLLAVCPVIYLILLVITRTIRLRNRD